MAKLTRRGFLIGGAVTGGALVGATVLGIGYLSSLDVRGQTPTTNDDGTVNLNAWLAIAPDGKIHFSVPRTEMGQGVYTALPMLIAEEMNLPLTSDITVDHPDSLLPMHTNWALGLQKRNEDMSGPVDWVGKRMMALLPFIGTGGSTSVLDAFLPFRQAGAAAREILLQAAARRWATDHSNLKAEGGFVINTATGEQFSYGDLARDAAKERPPRHIPLKPKADWTLIGTPVPRLDLPAKVDGSAVFGIDAAMDQDDMLFAAIRHAPVFGARVVGTNPGVVEGMDGVEGVVVLDSAVAVVARDSWTAKTAVDMLDIETSLPDGPLLTSAAVTKTLTAALDDMGAYVHRDDGGVDSALDRGKTVSATYETPFLAHATLEPMNATARVTSDLAEVWTPNQSSTIARFKAEESPLNPTETLIHTPYAGGGFGRRVEGDFTADAVQVASRFPGKLIKTIWSREEDMQHDVYRPAGMCRLSASLTDSGDIAGLDIMAAGQSPSAGFAARNMPFADDGTADPARAEGLTHPPYASGPVRMRAAHVDFPVPVGYWRSVGHSNNAYFIECFMDELAAAAGKDPMDFRQHLVRGHDRFAPLVKTLRAVSGWDTPAAPGVYRGCAIHESFRSFVGQVAEIRVEDDGGIRVERVTCVTDTGIVVNPDTVIAQMESGIIFGLTALFYGEITITDGRVDQGNFDSYDMVRMAQAPAIDVHLMDNDHAPGGAGEPGTPPIAPAVVNAIAKATGTVIRKLPITTSGFYAL